MFERYTESARRSLFFARYAVTEKGGQTIRAEHICIGLLRDPAGVVRRLLDAANVSAEAMRIEVEERMSAGEKVPTSVEIPFGNDAKELLQFACEEADALGHKHIGTEHLLLALLRVEGTIPYAVLTEHGLRLNESRKEAERLIAELPPPGGALSPAETRATIERIQQMFEQFVSEAKEKGVSAKGAQAIAAELESLRQQFI